MIKSKRGFTLVELLVVIAIIGILAGLVLAAMSTARAKARDAARRSDLRNIQNALELWADDNNSQYPAGAGALPAAPGAQWAAVGGTPIYMNSVPGDPGSGAAYTYTSPHPAHPGDAHTYLLQATEAEGGDPIEVINP